MKTVWNIRSNPPKKMLIAIDSTMTTAVSRVVSSLLGHTDFRSSDTVSCKKVTGLTRPASGPTPSVTDAMLKQRASSKSKNEFVVPPYTRVQANSEALR